MSGNSLIENNSFILKMKRKFLKLWNKIFKRETNAIVLKTNEEKLKINKEKILNLYSETKQYKVDFNALSKEELLYIIKLYQEEIDIVKRKIDIRIVENNLTTRRINEYKKKIGAFNN